jgi:hypothetical protein
MKSIKTQTYNIPSDNTLTGNWMLIRTQIWNQVDGLLVTPVGEQVGLQLKDEVYAQITDQVKENSNEID